MAIQRANLRTSKETDTKEQSTSPHHAQRTWIGQAQVQQPLSPSPMAEAKRAQEQSRPSPASTPAPTASHPHPTSWPYAAERSDEEDPATRANHSPTPSQLWSAMIGPNPRPPLAAGLGRDPEISGARPIRQTLRVSPEENAQLRLIIPSHVFRPVADCWSDRTLDEGPRLASGRVVNTECRSCWKYAKGMCVAWACVADRDLGWCWS
jgi:hypothetical protein